MYDEHKQFLRYEDQMRSFLEEVKNKLSAFLGAKVRLGEIVQDDSERGLTFRVRPLHRAHCDVVFSILDQALIDLHPLHDGSDYGVNAGFVLFIVEEVHARQNRPTVSVIEPKMMDYSDSEGWERELRQIEGYGNKVVAAILDWIQTVE